MSKKTPATVVENPTTSSLVYFPYLSIHVDVLATIVNNHAKQSADAKTAQIHSVLEKHQYQKLVQNINVLHMKIKGFHCKGRRRLENL